MQKFFFGLLLVERVLMIKKKLMIFVLGTQLLYWIIKIVFLCISFVISIL